MTLKTIIFAVLFPVGLSTLPAHADIFTYDLVTTNSRIGTAFGTVSGSNNTVTSFNITVWDGTRTFVLNSAARGFESSLATTETTASGTPVTLLRFFPGSVSYFFDLDVVGNFDTGLEYLGGENAYGSGQLTGIFERADLLDRSRHVLTVDDVSLTPESTGVTPEPSALLLVATGIPALVSFTASRRAQQQKEGLA